MFALNTIKSSGLLKPTQSLIIIKSIKIVSAKDIHFLAQGYTRFLKL
jgi:hypothetical protein